MSNNNENWVYLMSSNATKEYLVDILEVLSLPYGTVHHFRYQLRWLDEELRDKLPIKDKDENKNDELKNRRVVICYLYQKKNNSEWQWIAVYPIRSGILLDAYKTGDEDFDIAHFYFKVENYISYNGQDFTTILKNVIMKEKFNKAYASLSSGFDKYLSNKKESKSVFYKICESLKPDHLKSPEESEYFPFYCFINGLKDKNGKYLIPQYDSHTYKSYYEIEEGERYSFEFSTYFGKDIKKLPQYEINLLSDKKIFSTPSKYTLKASSRYDEESWAIVSSLLERDTWTSISFKTMLPNIDNKEALNLEITFPIKVIRKIYYRIIDAASDIGLAVVTGSIAFAKIIEGKCGWWDKNWAWFVLGGYVIWGICRFIRIKLWRG